MASLTEIPKKHIHRPVRELMGKKVIYKMPQPVPTEGKVKKGYPRFGLIHPRHWGAKWVRVWPIWEDNEVVPDVNLSKEELEDMRQWYEEMGEEFNPDTIYEVQVYDGPYIYMLDKQRDTLTEDELVHLILERVFIGWARKFKGDVATLLYDQIDDGRAWSPKLVDVFPFKEDEAETEIVFEVPPERGVLKEDEYPEWLPQ
jgi:hypothetical protein